MLKIIDCEFVNNGVGIRAPMSANIELSGTTMRGNGKAIDLYFTRDQLLSFGLPPNTPHGALRDAVHLLQGTKGARREQRLEVLADSALFKWLGHGASIASIGSALISFVDSL